MHGNGLNTQAQVFDFQVVIDAVLRAFATDARCFDATKRCYFVRDDGCVATQATAASDDSLRSR